ncbi:ATP-binding protein [Pelolinea submarina]|uniref:AAA domain-containing protein n=1 Tax=Pelolinea submarina TaxID=913107 RepID=A0A347ZS52_9CHLR|nr:phage infection protein [Pelolinea submarina]REG11302.1 hypothetical protein DFR64_1180 [Pelolinea submarina]BBB48133.1 hypothetical protein Pelsub_P1361 [Pelolinea submarina]
MRELIIDLENCHGIRKLQKRFDFSTKNVFAIYAPNGSMKTSFANTFKDITNEEESKDYVYPSRISKRIVKDENGNDLTKEDIFVIPPYDEFFDRSEKTSLLLVNDKLRREYENLYSEIDKAKDLLLNALQELSGSKKDIEKEISLAFMDNENDFYKAIITIKDEILSQTDIRFSNILYDVIFDEKVLQFLNSKETRQAIENYIKKYNELLSNSKYFQKGTFNYYNGSTICKSLDSNGFFSANHSLLLNGDKRIEIQNAKQLSELIDKEKENISKDKELRKKFADIEKLISRNQNTRAFEAYLEDHEELLPFLNDIEKFRKEIWKCYFRVNIELYKDLLKKLISSEKRKGEIEEIAKNQRTQWEEVINIFNKRFFVPFTLKAKNRISVILGQENSLHLEFSFKDDPESAEVKIEKSDLINVLSAGEKKALYILNIIFEIETRKKTNQETLFIVDDIADSFDYKNKYAIIQYLQDISLEPYFREIILTHNFDFFRTVQSRFVCYSNCLMVVKKHGTIELQGAVGVKNVFVNDWKPNFFNNNKKKIASIPFLRNLIEYLDGDKNFDYSLLTSLLHWKNDTNNICIEDLDKIYNRLFSTNGTSTNKGVFVVTCIYETADGCLSDPICLNLENKVILSIAIRLLAEKHMIEKISDDNFVRNISSNQTPTLLDKYKDLYPANNTEISVIQNVILMTPENIHLNSFMYEPILDMSEDHLRSLYAEVKAL